jgi:hypothetical protein
MPEPKPIIVIADGSLPDDPATAQDALDGHASVGDTARGVPALSDDAFTGREHDASGSHLGHGRCPCALNPRRGFWLGEDGSLIDPYEVANEPPAYAPNRPADEGGSLDHRATPESSQSSLGVWKYTHDSDGTLMKQSED